MTKQKFLKELNIYLHFYLIDFIPFFMNRNYLLVLSLASFLNCIAQKSFFKEIDKVQSLTTTPVDLGTNNIQKFKLFDLDDTKLKSYLATAPNDQDKTKSGISFDLPLADGSFETFIVKESPISTPEYTENHPNQRFFEGYSKKNNSVSTRFGYTENGFHAIILGLSETVFLTPTPDNQVISYKASDSKRVEGNVQRSFCGADKILGKVPIEVQKLVLSPEQITASRGDMLNTFRIAFLVNGEFTTQAGSMALASGWVAQYVNQLKAVYKREVSVDFTLVANNDKLIFSTISTPIGNNENTAIDRATTVIDSVLGAGVIATGKTLYDIGHLLGYAGQNTGSGLAQRPSICDADAKGAGVSNVGSSFNDFYAFHLILHEIGHQFGCSHSYNSGNSGVCTTRNPATAVEPGAGVTIMSYAATCDGDDIGNTILQFHTVNFDQIVSTISGAGCPNAPTPTGNTAPTVTGSANYTIPKSTPFTLTGSATDAQNDALTYVWEELDAGTTAGGPSSTYAPFFRSFEPNAAGNVRTFPAMTGFLGGANATLGENLPSVATTMNFRLVTRDNNAAGGGVAYAATNTVITVDGSSGPFLITNDPTGILAGNSTQTITWSVNNTNFTGNKDGVSFRSVTGLGAANVKISLSTDGGATFPTVLAASVPNNGSASVTLPNTATSMARIKVEAIGNIFFDISNSNFSINAVTPVNWLDFTATLDKSNNANLVWRTASEQNNKGYAVEMSSDGVNFVAVGEIKGAGTVSTESKYTFIKTLESPDRYYFRIKQEDYNGKSEYSKTVSLSLKGSFDAKFFPIPAKDELSLEIYTAISNSFRVDIVNAVGQTVLQLSNAQLDEGRHNLKLNTSSLNEGIYFYNIYSTDKILNGKIVIEK